MNPSVTCFPWLFVLVILPLPWTVSAVTTCTALATCSAPRLANYTTTCWGATCNLCPSVTYNGEWYPEVDLDEKTCGPVCTKPGTPAGIAECGAITGLFDRTRTYCENILNVPGYTTSPASYKTVTGDVLTFTAVCKSCYPEKPNAAGTGCGSEGAQTCTTLADCDNPLYQNHTISCFGGTCEKCVAFLSPSGTQILHSIPLNSTSCGAECKNPLTPAGVAECAEIFSAGENIRYCDSILSVTGYTSATSSYKTNIGDVVEFSGVCRRCPAGVKANAAGTGCDSSPVGPRPAPNMSPPLAPAPSPSTIPDCDTTADCSLPSADETGVCFDKTCYKCPAYPTTDVSGYVYSVNRNSTHCAVACTLAESPEGVTECKRLFEKGGGSLDARFCKSILRIPGYPSSPWNYADSETAAHRFTGVCWACDKGYTTNAAGDDCVLDTQPTPSPPTVPPPPPPPPAVIGAPPPLFPVWPPPPDSDTPSPPNIRSPPPPSGRPQNGSASIPPNAASPRVGRGFATWTTVMALVFASAALAATC